MSEENSPVINPRKIKRQKKITEGHDSTISTCSNNHYEKNRSSQEENLWLKSRVQYLEEKLLNVSLPTIQGVLQTNVRLHVEVEELRRKVADKEELLAAVLEAAHVFDQNETEKKPVEDADVSCIYVEPECADWPSSKNISDDEMDELTTLREENFKLCKMTNYCLNKIEEQDKEIKKLKLEKELVYARDCDSLIEKYEEVIKCKDAHIKELEEMVKEHHKNRSEDTGDSSGNLLQLLTRRLQALAYFLNDVLLSNKCVLGEDKQKLAENILEQSLALPVGLNLDKSVEFRIDESNLDISQTFSLQDITAIFDHHTEDNINQEQDGKLSLVSKRPCDTGVRTSNYTSILNKNITIRPRLKKASSSEDTAVGDATVLESQLTERSEQLEQEKTDLQDKLEYAIKQIKDLVAKEGELKAALTSEHSNLMEVNKNLVIATKQLSITESKRKDIEQQLSKTVQLKEKLHTEKIQWEAKFLESERSLRLATEERSYLEKELEETREELANAMEAKARLEIEGTSNVAVKGNDKVAISNDGIPSGEDRPTSSDQCIGSGRFSNLEKNAAVSLSPCSLFDENVKLKQDLAKARATVEGSLSRLNAASVEKKNMERAVCQQIHKTRDVLRKVRDQRDNHN